MRRALLLLGVLAACSDDVIGGGPDDPPPGSSSTTGEHTNEAGDESGMPVPEDDEDSSDEGSSSSGDSGEPEGESSSGSAPPPPASCVDYDDDANFDAAASFEADVIPVLQSNCASAACHSSFAASPAASLRLGAPPGSSMTTAQIDTVYAAIVNVPALKAHMNLVAPGDPAGSFLLAKAEYVDPSGCHEVACKPAGCGVAMPVGFPPLSDADLRTLRTWIRNGAAR